MVKLIRISGNGKDGSRSLSQGVVDADLEARLGPLRHLEATYRAFSMAQQVLEQQLGVPICIEGCGKCCELGTVMLWGHETRFLISWLLGQGAGAMERVMSICDGWLLDRDRAVPTYGMKATGNLSKDQWDLIGPQVDHLLLKTRCPMHNPDDKRCMIHDGRPLTCRAYGVTRWAAPMCPRPLSRIVGEGPEARAHIGEHSQLGTKLRQMVNKVLKDGSSGVRFLPAALYSVLRPEKLRNYIDNNLIATAKLVTLQHNPVILFQQELNEAWQRDVARARATVISEEES